MTTRKKTSGSQPRTKRKVSRTTKVDTSASRDTHRQTEVSDNSSMTNSLFASAEERHRKTQELAYLKAEQRNFASGYEIQDWLEAEKEVDEASRPLRSY